ncbi:MAG TPA: type VI secretion system ImpA family N-terminal domain-containing protein, partial [Caldimonas sp.]
MAAIDIDALLAPVSEAAPCGEDLGYDAAFLALEEAARGKTEQQFGETVIAAQDPDWRAMKEQSLALFARTRDVRVAIHLLRALTRLEGSSGFCTAIKVVHGLLEQHWDGVHPMLDAEENNDATMRLNALAPLADAATVLADVRSAAVGDARNGLTVRQIELAFGKAEPLAGE